MLGLLPVISMAVSRWEEDDVYGSSMPIWYIGSVLGVFCVVCGVYAALDKRNTPGWRALESAWLFMVAAVCFVWPWAGATLGIFSFILPLFF